MDTLAFGYILPTTGWIRDFNPLETCAARRTNNKPVYRLQQQSIRRLVLVPPYSVFCSISFRCGGLSIERSQKPLAPKITLVATHHDKQKQVEVKRSSRVNPHEIRIFSGCPYYISSPSARNGDFVILHVIYSSGPHRAYPLIFHVHICSSQIVFLSNFHCVITTLG